MSFFRIKCSNYFCVTPDQLSVISGEKGGGRRGEGEKGRRERGEPNNQVARSSEKFSAINLQILSNIASVLSL
jgi:hypothetical protein